MGATVVSSIDIAEIERCCKLFWRPNETHEVRSFGVGHVKAGWFDNPEALTREVARLEKQAKPKGIYGTLSARDRERFYRLWIKGEE